MRTLQSLKNSAHITKIDSLETIMGGKRSYGLVQWNSPSVAQFLFSGSKITSFSRVAPNVIRMTNAAGDDICVEW